MNRHSRRPASTASQDGSRPTDLVTLAGYRVLRTLSSGERADIYLGHAPLGRNTNVVAIKVFRRDADPASVDREITALGTTAPGCLPRLIDVATLADGCVVLVMERLGGGTVGSFLLRRHDRLDPGEAVTVIAPVIAALGAVHAIGLAHSTLSPGTVTFDEDGRPVLTGLGGLRELPPFGPRGGQGAPSTSRLDLVRDDYARLTAFMRAVFDRLDPNTPAARQSEFLAAWFEGMTSAVPFHPCLDELERGLFEWVPAAPVRREFPEQPSSWSTPGRIASPVADAEMQAENTGAARTHRLPEWLGLLHLPEDLAPSVMRALDGAPGASLLRRARERMTGQRRTVTVAVCVATAVTVLALMLFPPVAGPEDRGMAEPTAAAAGAERRQGPAPTGGIDPTGRAAIAGDDPLAAVPHLLVARAACLHAASGTCLAGIDQANSPIMAADLDRNRRAEVGETAPAASDYALFAAVLIERSGNSALVALKPEADAGDSKPASLLVIKGEAGWRLREIFEAVAGSD